jgi:hypothetical protein
MSVGKRIPSQHYLGKCYLNTSVMVFKFYDETTIPTFAVSTGEHFCDGLFLGCLTK